MSSESTELAPDQPDVVECIRRAQEEAGGDDRAFLRYLNECYVSKMDAVRVRSAEAAGGSPAMDRSSPSQQLLQDERYLRNARELARRTQGGTRIIGGTPVPPKEFLDCVAVGSDAQWGCTGTLIAPDVVVTAGHCIDFATRVFFGANVAKPGRIVRIRDRHRHPDYRKGGKHHDLMILVLAERVENIPVRPIAAKVVIDKATDGRAVGFGNTDPLGSVGYGIKRQVDVPIASSSCEGRTQGSSDAVAYGCDLGLEIVAGKPLLAKDSCTGDSGGPFYVQKDAGAWTLAGATSRATNKANDDCGDGGIYVRIDAYLSWIQQLPGVKLP